MFEIVNSLINTFRYCPSSFVWQPKKLKNLDYNGDTIRSHDVNINEKKEKVS
jgi:hypothetical protein